MSVPLLNLRGSNGSEALPVSKDEALEHAEARDAPIFERLCEALDNSIKIVTGTGRPVAISVEVYPSHILTRAIETYEALGWKAEVIDRDTDGNYLQLT
jgi:hypothetical protein